jgi:hypothetical protein
MGLVFRGSSGEKRLESEDGRLEFSQHLFSIFSYGEGGTSYALDICHSGEVTLTEIDLSVSGLSHDSVNRNTLSIYFPKKQEAE